MIFQQYFLACLSHASYLIGDESTGVAVLVDPQRDITGYLEDAERQGLRIEHVIETHFHADFLSGHLELAAATGAQICFGQGAAAEFPVRWLADDERISLGDVELEIRATPGHTPESISVVVYEHAGDETPYGVLTGDTLFIGDVGRPDLLSSEGVTAEELAGLLYRSIHTRLLTLPDATRVFPAHGAGSSCGKNLSSETSSTIGEQRRTNYAVRIPREDDFVAAVTEGQPVAPAYFPYDAHLNREQRDLLDDQSPPSPLSLDEVLAAQEAGAVVLDTRDPADFARGHLRHAVNVGLAGRFAEFAGDVLRPSDEIVLVCDEGRATEARVRLGRIGYDRVTGCLEGDVAGALAASPGGPERGSRVTATELAVFLAQVPARPITIVDVRNPSETEAGRLPGSVNIPLSQLTARLGEIPLDRPVVTHCASGYRSSIAASVIARAGHTDVSDLIGGYQAWETVATDHLEGALPG
ncbi:MAG TPA: rhodanese-like domain-containing protein [Acidimicrobiales bacterium]|nr:rhodanese-like domain-containing protein [Acidimicrobiales bacterium]